VLGQPTILYPTNEIFTKSITPLLMWQSLPGVSQYAIIVSSSSSFADTIINTTSNKDTFRVLPGFLYYDTTYFWEVAADTFQAVFSPFASFIPDSMGNPPAMPYINIQYDSDLPGANDSLMAPVSISWPNNNNANYSVFKLYHLNNMYYADTLYSNNSNTIYGTQFEPLLISDTWTYCRLTAYNDFGDSSIVDSFYFHRAFPKLISPTDRAIVPLDSVILSSAIDVNLLYEFSGFNYYNIQLSTSPSFNNYSTYQIFKNVVAAYLKSYVEIDSIYPLQINPNTLYPDTVYWWRVNYTDQNNDTIYSPAWSFTVDTSSLVPLFTYSITGLNNDSVIFTNTSYAPEGASWFWNFGDGSTSNDMNPVHYYTTNGNYNVCLTIINSAGTTKSACQTITLGNINTLAAFDYSINNMDSVTFFNLSTGNIASYYWTFGDGSYSSVQNPNHVFAQGTYNVCLSVKDTSDNISQNCLSINVNDTNCVAVFNYFINENDSVYFADNSVGTVTQWFWNMGNGVTSDLQNTWLQLNPGEYNVMLSVSGPGNCLSSQTKTVIVGNCLSSQTKTVIVGADSCLGTVDFDYFVNSQIDTVSFISTANQWNSVKYFWSFGDGSVSVLQNPVHSYSSEGIQLVTLTVSDSSGSCIRSTQKNVQLGNVTCSAAFTYFADSTTVAFNNASIGTATNLNWFFGDGGQSSLPNPVHTYPSPGYYSVELYTYNSANQCMDYSEQNILAGALGTDCQAGFKYFSDLTKDSSIYFSNQSVGPDLSDYIWNFGDSKTSSMQNPSHHYTDSGYFNVCLTISNQAAGCYNSNCQIIKVGNTDQDCYIRYIYTVDTSNHTVLFQDKSFGNPISWQWYFGSDDSSHSQNPGFTYSANGYYPARLIAITQSGCRGEYLQLISINEDSLKAVFMVKGQGSINLLKINEGPYSQSLSNLEDNRMKSVSLSGAAYGDPTEFLWDFGDGTFDSTTLSPTHTYASFGVYEVCLTIWEPETNEESQYCSQITIDSVSNATPVNTIIANQITLENYPDPVVSYMNIQYSLPMDSKVNISIFDQLGREDAIIVSKNQTTGTYNIIWQNNGLESGLYYLKFNTENITIVKKILIIGN